MYLRLLLIALCTLGPLSLTTWGKGEYSSTYLYTETNPADTGGFELRLADDAPPARRVIAIGRRSGNPYLGELAENGKLLRWKNLPVDVYDVLIVGKQEIYEGLQLIKRPKATPPAEDQAAVLKELNGVEGFFDQKRAERMEFESDPDAIAERGESCRLLAQMWVQEHVALAESGAVLAGTIHSIDLFVFEKPVKGWQLVRRRQLYREEENFKTPMKTYHVEALGGIRVIKSTVQVGPVNLVAALK